MLRETTVFCFEQVVFLSGKRKRKVTACAFENKKKEAFCLCVFLSVLEPCASVALGSLFLSLFSLPCSLPCSFFSFFFVYLASTGAFPPPLSPFFASCFHWGCSLSSMSHNVAGQGSLGFCGFVIALEKKMGSRLCFAHSHPPPSKPLIIFKLPFPLATFNAWPLPHTHARTHTHNTQPKPSTPKTSCNNTE